MRCLTFCLFIMFLFDNLVYCDNVEIMKFYHSLVIYLISELYIGNFLVDPNIPFPASDVCGLLITFAISLYPNKAK